MTELKILDEAHLFRIEISGRLAGQTVDQVREHWQSALDDDVSRRITIDISQMTGYDVSGFQLLRDLQSHGTYVSARNPEALAFLNEISSHEAAGPALIYQATENKNERKKAGKTLVRPITRAVGAG